MNNRIKQLRIEGYKKFRDLRVEFDPKMNILVGENESGKSTILDAIRLCLCQDYRNSDKAYILDLLNLENLKNFKENRTIETLPKIRISLELELDGKLPHSQDYFGETHCFGDDARSGITFECEFDRDFASDLAQDISDGNVPIEYYVLSWKTFSGMQYSIGRRPLNFVPIDASERTGTNAMNSFAKRLFTMSFENAVQMKAKNNFRHHLKDSFEQLSLPEISAGRRLAINDKKLPLESLLSVVEEGVLLENKGKGCENIVKTKIALEKAKTVIDVVTIEEPENHLSYTNMRKMIEEIRNRPDGSQIIIATHSNMIVSNLGYSKIIWMEKDSPFVHRMAEQDRANESFFEKADTARLLDFILAPRVLLVEGPTEYMLLPKIVKMLHNQTVEELGVAIIACDGISYKRYLSIAENMDKRVAVVTDNDGEQRRIAEANAYNAKNQTQRIFTSLDINKQTWEFCLYDKNKGQLDKMFPPANGAKYVFRGLEYHSALGYMLCHKADAAYEMASSKVDFIAPDYVKEAIEWVLK